MQILILIGSTKELPQIRMERFGAAGFGGGVATTAKMNPRFPLPYFATWHRPTALETARALRALNPKRLAPGHGKVVEDPGAAMDAAIAKGS